MQARELVWRAWFAGDVKSLEELLPADTIAISSGDREWHKRDGILREAAEFHEHGGKLTRLEFPTDRDSAVWRCGRSLQRICAGV